MNIITGHRGLCQPLIYAQHKKNESKLYKHNHCNTTNLDRSTWL